MSVLMLNSLQFLFRLLEEEQIENFTRRILILMRDEDFTLQQQRKFREVLKKVASVTEQATVNYAVATAVIAAETSDLEEKRVLTQSLIQLTRPLDCGAEILEISSRAVVNLMTENELPLSEKKQLLNQLHTMTLRKNATLSVTDAYAQGLFNMTVDEPTLKGKRELTNRLKTLVMLEKGTEFTMVPAAKALVNLACITTDFSERKSCLNDLEAMMEKSQANREIMHIYAKGLINYIGDETNLGIFRQEYFEKLEKMAQADDATWIIRGVYAQALLSMALNTENIYEKRRYMRQMMKLVEMPECMPEIFITAARAMFNHQIDESSLKCKKDCIARMEMILERSGNARHVLREYARSIVNLAVDDPVYAHKREYSEKLRKLSETKGASLDIVLEYAKSLINLAFTDESAEQKVQDLTTLLNIDREIHYTRTDLAETTSVDYICMKAEALALMIQLEPHPVERRKLLRRIPKVETFKTSDYLSVFANIYEEAMQKEADWSVKHEMADFFETVLKVMNISKMKADLLEKFSAEDLKKLPPEVLKVILEELENKGNTD